jgi:hypothetical protein
MHNTSNSHICPYCGQEIDALMAYRNIVNSGDCNECKEKKNCKYAPKAGQPVRYNCPFYKRMEGEG